MSKWSYTKGLHDLGNSVYAYLQPDGTWGWSNAGIVVDGEASLLIDTLYDLKLTRDMLDTMRKSILAASHIDMVVNTPYGIAGPRGMDPKIVKVLHDAFKKGMEDPSFVRTIAQFDQEPYYLNSADYHDFAMKQIEDEKRLVEELGLKDE